MPSKSAPDRPEERTPEVRTPDEPRPEVRTPDEPTPDEPTPDEPTPDEPTPDEPTPDEPTPDEPTPDESTPDELTPGRAVGRAAARSDDRRGGRRGQTSKTHILDCAISLLGEGGYGGLSISNVCKAASVSPTSIYWHFGDKAGLMAAMVKYSLRRDFDNFMAEFEKYRSTDKLIDAYLQVFRSQIVSDTPSCWAVIATLAEGRGEAPEIAALVNEARRKQIEFARGWGETVAKAENPDAFAHMIVGFNNFAATVWRHAHDEAEVDAVLASMRVLMVMMAEKMTRKVDDADFRRCMATWGYEPTETDP